MATIDSIEQLEDNLSTPTPSVFQALADCEGDLLVLGAGGKMGPSLSRMAKRAIQEAGTNQKVLAVSRFSDRQQAQQLEDWGIETIKGDLLDPKFIDSLPKVENVIYMAGKKFGTEGAEHLTWATNTYLPSLVCSHFRDSRIIAFSTGNVYPQLPVDGPGASETEPPNPIGEYGMSCLGRERMFDYFSRKFDIPTVIIRLNYATELRYGVLVDLAQKVFNGKPVSLAMGYFNVIWQTDANAIALCSMNQAEIPPYVLNVTSRELHSCRAVAEQLGVLMGKEVLFDGTELPQALHSSVCRSTELYTEPQVGLDEMLEMTAEWVKRGGPLHGKSTHFEVADGKF